MARIKVSLHDKKFREILKRLSRRMSGPEAQEGMRRAAIQMLKFVREDFLDNSTPGGSSKYPKIGIWAVLLRKGKTKKFGSFEAIDAERDRSKPLQDTGEVLMALTPDLANRKGRRIRKTARTYSMEFVGPKFATAQEGGTLRLSGQKLRNVISRRITSAFRHKFLKRMGLIKEGGAVEEEVRKRPVILDGQFSGERGKKIVADFASVIFKGLKKL